MDFHKYWLRVEAEEAAEEKRKNVNKTHSSETLNKTKSSVITSNLTDKKNLRPLIEGYRPDKRFKVIKYDVAPNKTTVGYGTGGHAIVLRVPWKQYVDI